jgi:hypothetical protein
MATIAIRRTAVQGLTAKQRKIVQFVMSRLDLNDPAAFVDGANVHWLVFDDTRISLDDIAILGTLVRLIGNAAVTNYDPTDDTPDQVRTKIRQALNAQVVRADTVAIPEGSDPFATVLAAQNAPAAVRAFYNVPQDWVAE